MASYASAWRAIEVPISWGSTPERAGLVVQARSCYRWCLSFWHRAQEGLPRAGAASDCVASRPACRQILADAVVNVLMCNRGFTRGAG